MKRWHLYLDESGTFNAKKDNGQPEHNLVGGFILPETDEKTHKAIIADWVYQAEAEARANFPDATGYDFGHCSENGDNWELRKRIQPFLLERYRQYILNANGRIVIFDGGRQLADVDNTSTFLSILSKGIIRLYHRLEAETPDNKVELVAHCARRVPHGQESEPPIESDKYKQTMKHIAFLLCEYPGKSDEENPFYRTVDTLDIMPSRNNPRTTVCDYLCNTYQNVKLYGTKGSGWGQIYRDTYIKKHCMVFDTTQSESIGDGELKQMEKEHTYVPMLIRILNRSNPEEALVNSYFERLNNAPYNVQQMFKSELIDRLNVETQRYYLDVFKDVTRQIERIIELLKAHMLNQVLLTEILANAQLFLLTMHTHLGQDAAVLFDMAAFEQTVAGIQDSMTATQLWVIYYNRLLVFQTDRFEFDLVEKGFNKLSTYWKNFFNSYLILSSQPQNTSVQYGREIGSYLQMVRFQLRRYKLDGEMEDFETLRDLAREFFIEGCRHLTGEDLSRLYQTMCDVESEIGNYEFAFCHLYAAAMLSLGNKHSTKCAAPFSAQSCREIFAAGWEDGTMKRPFIYYRFVRLVNEMVLADDHRTRNMLLCIPVNCMPMAFENTKAIDMRICIKWKLGSTYAHTGNREKGLLFLNNAIEDALKQQERPFDAIALAIACERTMLGLGGKEKIPDIYAEFRRKTMDVKAQDLFNDTLPEDNSLLSDQAIMRASRLVAY